ncbi:hypothetical protein PYW08_006939 [Mythimna loreyi]|uniref:Uncharacterized protein n=1 Tax=Mythimna loreyi TaxID=667449 RepID=A0ACC2R9M0_9NEOP|nr:hypothetical protein PYW08_006939 [Mythimna loreyi]
MFCDFNFVSRIIFVLTAALPLTLQICPEEVTNVGISVTWHQTPTANNIESDPLCYHNETLVTRNCSYTGWTPPLEDIGPCLKVVNVTFELLLISLAVHGWKAVPANQATYSLRSAIYGPTEGLTEDELLPRNYVHSIYKFGWCTPDSIQKVYLRKTANITLTDWQATQANYLYLLEDGDTIDHRLACIVMYTYVPRRHLFRKSRLPVYYCQGDLFYVMKTTYQRLDIHEFYLYQKLNLPANFYFQFYHPPPV